MKAGARFILVLFGAAIASQAAAQKGQTIPEIIASGGGWIGPSVPSGAGPSMNDVLNQADAIVRGVVGKALPSYMSEDEREVYTDYPIASAVFLFQREVVGSAVPGKPPTATITVRGGTVDVNGVPFTAVYKGQPVLRPGSEGLFLLKRVSGKYRIATDYFGVFEIVDGKIIPASPKPSFASEYRNLAVDVAAARIVQMAQSAKSK